MISCKRLQVFLLGVLASVFVVAAFPTRPVATAPIRSTNAARSFRHVSEKKALLISQEVSVCRSALTKLQSMEDGTDESRASPAVDYDALLKYHGSIAVQMTLFASLFAALDALVAGTGFQIPFPVVGALFYAASLKSRIFNPLNNERPKMPTGNQETPSKGFRDRIMPSWTPPGVIFPIMWILIIGPTRAYSSALVYESTHAFLHPSLLAFVLHLSVGDVWNSINNVDRRFGASVTGVLCVTASVVNAAYQYYTVSQLAGRLLGLTLLWFGVASSLVTATWRLNPDPLTGEKDPLYPSVGESKTELVWFSSRRSLKKQ